MKTPPKLGGQKLTLVLLASSFALRMCSEVFLIFRFIF
jgi:hypothetical protein